MKLSRFNPLFLVITVVSCLLITSCSKPSSTDDSGNDGNSSEIGRSAASLYDDRAIADESNTSEWLAYGRTHSETRFSPLADINKENVGGLKVDWFLDLPNDVGLVSTPLVVDGVMYFISG